MSNQESNIVGTANVIVDPNDPNNSLLDLGLELCDKLGWKEGDLLEWIENDDETWTLKKI